MNDTIEEYLITKGGYSIGNPYNFDSKIAINKDTFFNFIELTQQKKWKNIVAYILTWLKKIL